VPHLRRFGQPLIGAEYIFIPKSVCFEVIFANFLGIWHNLLKIGIIFRYILLNAAKCESRHGRQFAFFWERARAACRIRGNRPNGTRELVRNGRQNRSIA
jgi:hypothetical protein